MNLGAGELTVIIGVVLAFGAFLLWGNRPSAEQFAQTNGLELDDQTQPVVTVALRRTYRGRVFGGAAGFVVAVAIAALGATQLNFTGGLAAMFAGSLFGIAVAQLTRSPASGPAPIASLEARDPDDYRPHRATLVIVLGLLVLVAYGVAMVAAYDENRSRAVVTTIVVGLIAIATVVLGRWLQRRIVEQAQDHRNLEHARVDDALRAGAVRAVHHAVLGILLCGIALLGVTGATSTFRLQVERGNTIVMTLPADTVRSALDFSREPPRVMWTEPDGANRSAVLAPSRPGTPYTLIGRTTSGIAELSPVGSIGFWLAFVAGIAALFEWRQAARSWRRPSPRGRIDPATPSALVTTGGAS